MVERKIRVIYTKDDISRRVAEIARDVERDFQGGELVVVGVLKGSFIFMADLVRQIKRPLTCDFVRVSSYEHDLDTGIVRMEFDMTQPVDGKNVLLVEDIVDSGKTLRHLRKHIEAKGPAKLKIATLLYKGTPTNSKSLVDYIGFDCPQEYVVGFGMDSEGLYRSLPHIGVFE